MTILRAILLLAFGLVLLSLVASMAETMTAGTMAVPRRLLTAVVVLCVGGALAGAAGVLGAFAVGQARAAFWLAIIPALCASLGYGALFEAGRLADWEDGGSSAARFFAVAMFMPFSITLLLAGGRDLLRQWRLLRRASPVEARIVAVAVEGSASRAGQSPGSRNRGDGAGSFTPSVRFNVVIDGVRHEGTRLTPGESRQVYRSREAAQKALRGLAPGQVVSAWADPGAPSSAYLFREATPGPAVYLMLGILVPTLVYGLAAILL